MARLIDWLRSVEFDDIVNSVIKQDSGAEGSLMNYKMAFDCLTRMTPGEDDGVKISISEDLCICDGKKYVNMNDPVYAPLKLKNKC